MKISLLLHHQPRAGFKTPVVNLRPDCDWWRVQCDGVKDSILTLCNTDASTRVTLVDGMDLTPGNYYLEVATPGSEPSISVYAIATDGG